MSYYRPDRRSSCPSCLNTRCSTDSISTKQKIGLIAIAALVLLYFVSNFSSQKNEITTYYSNYTPQRVSKILHSENVNIQEITKSHEKNVFSQNGEDGIIDRIFELIGVTNKYFVEFGTQDGTQTNTRVLREKKDAWTGLLMDGGFENASIGLHKEFIFHSNIVSLFEKYNVPSAFDLLSTDTDWKDFWIVEAILKSRKYKPRVTVAEVNSCFSKHLPITVPKDFPRNKWRGSLFNGASALAMTYLYQSFNYSLVYCERIGINCFWISNDELSANEIRYFNDKKNIMRIIRCHPICRIRTMEDNEWWNEVMQIGGNGHAFGYQIRKFNMSNKELDTNNRCIEKE